jgi:glycosyltransferase involved in cell wall biosynthesis
VKAADTLDILFLDSWFSDRARGSGSAVAIAGLAGGLRSLGHRVTILRPRFHFLTADLTRIAANVDLRFRVRRLPAHLIVGFDLDGCFLAGSSASYVVSLKGVMADELRYESGWNRIRFRFLSRLERRNARRADRVIVTSEHSRRVATAAYGLDPERLGVVPEGIDLESWSARSPEPPRTGGSPSIVSVARQYRRKNTAVLIRAMAIARQSIPDVRLRIVGDGPELQRLRALVRSLNLGDTVAFVGSVGGIHEIRSELFRADVFCLPSLQEGFGIVFLEAMAAGLPIVAANCAAVPETAPHGEVSLLVQPHDVEGLADALVRLLKDEALRARLAAAGAVRWRRFAWREVAAQFLAEVRLG